jgi:hypothetical protein
MQSTCDSILDRGSHSIDCACASFSSIQIGSILAHPEKALVASNGAERHQNNTAPTNGRKKGDAAPAPTYMNV